MVHDDQISVIEFIKKVYPDIQQWQMVWVENALHIIKEDKRTMDLKDYQKYILARRYGPEEYEKIVDVMLRMNIIKEDKDMPVNTTRSIEYVWGEKKPEDYYAEVWEFMKETDEMDAEDFCECFGSGREVFDIFSNFEEAKKTLDEYKAKNEIKPGDYVKAKDKNSIYANYDILVIDVEKPLYNGDYAYRCIGRKHGADPALISENSYVFIHLFHSYIEKTGKHCKHFDYAMYTLFEDC